MGADDFTRAMPARYCTSTTRRYLLPPTLDTTRLFAQMWGTRKFVVTPYSKYDLPVAPNLLKRDFTSGMKQRHHIASGDGWLYLARGDRPVQPPSSGLEHAAVHADQPGD